MLFKWQPHVKHLAIASGELAKARETLSNVSRSSAQDTIVSPSGAQDIIVQRLSWTQLPLALEAGTVNSGEPAHYASTLLGGSVEVKCKFNFEQSYHVTPINKTCFKIQCIICFCTFAYGVNRRTIMITPWYSVSCLGNVLQKLHIKYISSSMYWKKSSFSMNTHTRTHTPGNSHWNSCISHKKHQKANP